MFNFFYKLWDRLGFLPFLDRLEPMPRDFLQQALNKETLRLTRIISLGLLVFYVIFIFSYILSVETKQGLLVANVISIILLAVIYAISYLPSANNYAITISVIASIIVFTNALYRLYALEQLVVTISIIIGILVLSTVAVSVVWLFWVISYTCVSWFLVIQQLDFPVDFSFFYYSIILIVAAFSGILICRMRCRTLHNFNNLRWHESLQKKELERVQENLRAQNEELARVDELKSAFLANMSHEFRTPLTAINGFAEVLETESFGPLNEKQKSYLNNISVSGTQLLDLVNNILDLSSFEANQMPISLTTSSISQVVQTALSVLKQDIDKNKILISLSLDAEDTAYFDSVIIGQVVLNLLDNAIKFSENSSVIEIKSYNKTDNSNDYSNGYSTDYAVIEITDSGIGISEENQSLLFLPFSQVDSSINRSHEGAGLGLALSKKIVEKHGGEIFVRSELGKGSTFGFSLLKSPKALTDTTLEDEGEGTLTQEKLEQKPAELINT